MRRALFIAVIPFLAGPFLAGCSSSPANQPAKTGAELQAPAGRVAASSNPIAKYLELVGFRITERSPGKLQIRFGVVNHSDADLGEIAVNVQLSTTASKPSDPPLVEFTAKIPSLGPEELREASADVPSRVRPYELPDWQYLRTSFQVVEPK